MAGLEGIDASKMDLVDALQARWEFDDTDHVAKPILKHADFAPVAVLDDDTDERVIRRVRFGMPVGGPGAGRLITNARDDKLATSRTWKPLLLSGRCLTAVSYVVERDRDKDVTYRIQRRDGGLIVVPGLSAVRHYRFTSTGNEYDDLGHVQITAEPNRFVAQVHDRFIVELADRRARDAWMDGADATDLFADAVVPDDHYELVPISNGIWKREADATPIGDPIRSMQSGLDAF